MGKGSAKKQGKDGGGGSAIPVLEVHKLDPAQFWAEHVSQRRPALIRGHLTDAGWRASGLWTDNYLVQRAGDAEVLVEVRGGAGAAYGKGVKKRMTFGAFVRAMAAGDANLYLTAQQRPTGPDGHPELYSEPLASLRDDFVLLPRLLGHLVPQSVNVWMGAAQEGSSSGLHHDVHDNLYVLLRGRKRFRLYPPSDAPRMYTVGQLAAVHPNGRIVYRGQGDVRADGADAKEAALAEARAAAEEALAEAEAAVAHGEQGAMERLAAAEAALEEALEAELSDAMDGGDGGGDDGDSDSEDSDGPFGAMRDDYVDSDAEDMSEDGDGDGDEGEQEARRRGQGTRKKGGDGEGKDGGLVVDNDTPPSFSRVDLRDGVSDAELAAAFPRFPGRGAALEVEVEVGSMLYLPAGWFHEVTSYGDAVPGQPNGGHLAFNYWFHPPDRLDPSLYGFRRPYVHSYWPAMWRRRLKSGRYSSPGDESTSVPDEEDAPGPNAAHGKGHGGEARHTWHRDAQALPSALLHHNQQGHADHHVGFGAKDTAGHQAHEHLHSPPPPAAAAAARGAASTAATAAAAAAAAAAGQVSVVLSPRSAKRVRLADVGGGEEAEQPEQARAGLGRGGSGGLAARELGPAQGAEEDGDLDPPRRTAVQNVRQRVMAALAALQRAERERKDERRGKKGGGGEAGGGGEGGEGGGAAGSGPPPEVQALSDGEYHLLLALDAQRRQAQAVQAMQAQYMRHVKLQAVRRMLARLPPGRRHHPVIAVKPEVRRYRPAAAVKAGGVKGGAGGKDDGQQGQGQKRVAGSKRLR